MATALLLYLLCGLFVAGSAYLLGLFNGREVNCQGRMWMMAVRAALQREVVGSFRCVTRSTLRDTVFSMLLMAVSA